MSRPRCRTDSPPPGAEFVMLQQMRPRETKLAFEMRIAALEAGRRLVIEACRVSRSLRAALRAVGVCDGNTNAWLTRLGLRRVDLRSILGSAITPPPPPPPQPVIPTAAVVASPTPMAGEAQTAAPSLAALQATAAKP